MYAKLQQWKVSIKTLSGVLNKDYYATQEGLKVIMNINMTVSTSEVCIEIYSVLPSIFLVAIIFASTPHMFMSTWDLIILKFLR